MFIQQDRQFIPEHQLNFSRYRHRETGACLYMLENDDENRVFAAAFRTPSEDSSGKAHILEHCCLSGSERYPLKEPFLNLMKGSYASFLNAMTLDDRTIYPFASSNTVDFEHLLGIYLDAIFHPLVLRDPYIFYQEASHLEWDQDGKPFFTGVVYNEMAQAFQSAPEIMRQHFRKTLYPNNAYQYDSGGIAEAMESLEWQNLKDFYRRTYHPSNAVFYLYGRSPFTKSLDQIDRLLSEFSMGERLPIPPATDHIPDRAYAEAYYPSREKTRYGGMHFVLPESLDPGDVFLIDLVVSTLFNCDFSPVREHFLEEGTCQDFYAEVDRNGRNPNIELCLSGLLPLSQEQLEEKILEALKSLDQEDLQTLCLASLSRRSFSLRESNSGSFPRGLILAFPLLMDPFSLEDPSLYLRYEDTLKRTEERIRSGEVAGIIRRCFTENPQRATLILKADPRLSLKQDSEREERARRYADSLSQEDIQALKERNRRLKERQEEADTEEALQSLPRLRLSDIPREKKLRDAEEREVESVPLLFYPAFTSSVAYLACHFDIGDASAEELFLMTLLQEALGSLPTEQHSHLELSRLLYGKTGGFSASFSLYPEGRYFQISLRLLEKQLPDGLGLLREILSHTRFTSFERLDQLCMSLLETLRLDLLDSAVDYALEEAGSGISPRLLAASEAGGLRFYLRLQSFMKEESARRFAVYESLADTAKKLFSKKRLTLSYIGSEAGLKTFESLLPALFSDFSAGTASASPALLSPSPLRQAYTLPGSVQDIALAASLRHPSFYYRGEYPLLCFLIENGYLWQKLRVLGGAYGASFAIRRNGEVLMSSYRDPRLPESLEAFQGIPSFVRSLSLSSSELEQYKIGTLAAMDLPLSPPSEGKAAVSRRLRQISLDDLQREREELIAASLTGLKALADPLEIAFQNLSYCVIGSRSKILDEKHLFSDRKKLF